MSIKHRFSKIFQPIINVPKNANLTRLDATSNSQRVSTEFLKCINYHLVFS